MRTHENQFFVLHVTIEGKYHDAIMQLSREM